MKSHEMFRELFDRISPKELAADLGLSVSMIYKWAEPTGDAGSGTPNPLERIAALLKITGDVRIAEWVCRCAGGFYTKSPAGKSDENSDSVITATNQIVQDFAEMLSAIATAAVDNAITPAESLDIRTRWEHLKSVTESFVCCCEHGNFEAVRNAPETARLRKLPPG
jgi:transcriptional regulator with XRE-family HTH domain